MRLEDEENLHAVEGEIEEVGEAGEVGEAM